MVTVKISKLFLVHDLYKLDLYGARYTNQFLLSHQQGICVLFVGWFVSRITGKLLNGYLQNLDGGWVSTKNRP